MVFLRPGMVLDIAGEKGVYSKYLGRVFEGV
jgi:hypothetical protein